jgi:hypothetical protein
VINHASVALVGASAFVATVTECFRGCHRWRLQCCLCGATLACFIVLAVMPCPPEKRTAHRDEAKPTLEARPDIDHTEKLLLAHYRRIKQERELTNAWTP